MKHKKNSILIKKRRKKIKRGSEEEKTVKYLLVLCRRRNTGFVQASPLKETTSERLSRSTDSPNIIRTVINTNSLCDICHSGQ